jgi:hypothetical protein
MKHFYLLASLVLAFSFCASAQIFGGSVQAGRVTNGNCTNGQVPTYNASGKLTGCAANGSASPGFGLVLNGPNLDVNTAVIPSNVLLQTSSARICRSTTGNDTYTCSLNPVAATLGNGTTGSLCVLLTVDTPSSGASTLNVDSLGAKSLLNADGTNATTLANKPTPYCYDGTQFVAQGASGGGTKRSVMQLPIGFCNGVMTFAWRPAAFTPYCALPDLNAAWLVASATNYNYMSFRIPDNWDGTTAPDLKITVFDDSTSGTTTVILRAAISCSTSLDSQTYPTDTNSSTVTLNGTNYTAFTATFTGLTMSGCSAGQFATIRLGRNTTGGGTYAGVNGITVTAPALIWTVN